MSGKTKLGDIIRDFKLTEDCNLDALSAMSSKTDPYRRDTDAGHRDAAWVAKVLQKHVSQERIHNRGLHYVLVTVSPKKPNGKPYRNTDADWKWLSENAIANARWLGAIPFDRITDERNHPPLIRVPQGYDVEIKPIPHISLPSPEELEPQVVVTNSSRHAGGGYEWREQPYTLIICGEKTSLDPVIAPIAKECNAGVFLPTGEMSDSMIWQMAQMIEDCKRPSVVFYLSDFDPSGFSMPKNVARKLQALGDLGHLTHPVTVHDVALTFEQCEELDLPSSPIKKSDKRAPKWVAATGRQQTEIDALSTLQPEVLSEILRDAIAPYWDETLGGRVHLAVQEYEDKQAARLADKIGQDRIENIRDVVAEKLSEAQTAIDYMLNAFTIDEDDFDLDELIFPEPKLDGEPSRPPLLDPNDDWLTQTAKLVARKKYDV